MKEAFLYMFFCFSTINSISQRHANAKESQSISSTSKSPNREELLAQLPTIEAAGSFRDTNLRNWKSQFEIISNAKNEFIKDLEIDQKKYESAHDTIQHTKTEDSPHLIQDLTSRIESQHKVVTDLETELFEAKRREHELLIRKEEQTKGLERNKEANKKIQSEIDNLFEEIQHKKNYLTNAFLLYNTLRQRIQKEEDMFHSIRKIRLLNHWQRSHSKQHACVGYIMDYNGVIHLQGVVTGGSLGHESGSIFQVDDFAVPVNHPVLLTLVDNYPGRVDILNNGVVMASLPEKGVWVSLDGINYVAKESPVHGIEVAKSWMNTSVHSTLAYLKGRDGVVHLSGIVQSKDHISNPNKDHGILIGTLPEDVRPGKWIVTRGISENALGRIDIQEDGSILAVYPLSAEWFSLDGISFISRYESRYICVSDLHSGWIAYNSHHGCPGYLKTNDGIVYLGGIVKNGRVDMVEGVVFILPENYRPNSIRVLSAIGDNEIFRVDVHPDGHVIISEPVGAQHSWVSLDGLTFHIEGLNCSE